MKTLSTFLLIALTTVTFAKVNPTPDAKCDDANLAKNVKFDYTRDKSHDVKTKTTKQTKVNVAVANNSNVSITVRLDFVSGGKIIQTYISKGKIAPHSTQNIGGDLLLMKSKQVSDIRISMKNTECTDPKKNTVILMHKDIMVMKGVNAIMGIED